MIKVGFLSVHDPRDRNSFSGTVYYMYQSLSERNDINIKVIGTEHHQKNNGALDIAYKVVKKVPPLQSLSAMIERKKHSQNIRSYSLSACNDLNQRKKEIDIIVAPFCAEVLHEIDIEKYGIPIVYITDATPGFLKHEYKWPISDEKISAERDSFKKSSAIVFSSFFMMERARKEFPEELKKRRIYPINMGLNMDKTPGKSICKTKKIVNVHLLFVGTNWERKNGCKFLELISCLERMNHNVQATIVGCEPPHVKASRSLRIYPYLDKNVPEEQQTYETILSNTHFLILPTLADCSPMVIAEANAYGIPVLASDVGGIPDLVAEGKSGYLFPTNCDVTRYAQKIQELLSSNESYLHLRETAYKHFLVNLTWQSHASRLSDLLHHVLEHNRSDGSEGTQKPQVLNTAC